MVEYLSVYDFGRQLLKTRDLDPVYVVLHESQLDQETLKRWLLAYWCFYHCGTASWIAYGGGEEDYWKRMRTAAGSKEYPRSAERRHFRGANAAKSVEWLQERGVAPLFTPLIKPSVLGTPCTVAGVMRYIQTWVGFGPWISFKVADMLERLNLAPVTFDRGAMFLFDSPRQGAERLWSETWIGEPLPPNVGQWAVSKILTELNPAQAPPRYERLLNAQEAETILCKWLSYQNGCYHVGEDIEAVQKGLRRFSQCQLSAKLLDAGTRAELW